MFPYYLSIGMTEAQYWDGDPWLAEAYRKAEQIRQERKNREFWLMGAYVHEAVGSLEPFPVIFVSKKGQPQSYLKEPFDLGFRSAAEKEADKDKQTFEKGKRFMEQLMADVNRKFERKGGSEQ